MARRPSLKPQLNQIRTWVGEGVTDIWIAHQLDRTPAEVADFRRKYGLVRPGEPAPAAKAPRAAAKKPTAAKAETAKKEPATRTRGGRKAAEPAAETAADSVQPAA